ncbi:MAG TPA: EamA family transporter [Actinomycetes bacterium]
MVAAAGLALLLPVLPYALELIALRRLESAAFGTLMSVEPAAALLVGVVVLGQVPQAIQALGVLLVTAAAPPPPEPAGAPPLRQHRPLPSEES